MSRLKIGILKDENFKVGNYVIKMIKVGGEDFTIEVKGSMDARYDINRHGVEVLPGVLISAGNSEKFIPPGKDFAVIRAVVVIEAPPEVIIHRFKGPERFAA